MLEKIKKLNLPKDIENELILFISNNFEWSDKQLNKLFDIIKKIKEINV